MKVAKEEFQALLMLYLSNADGKRHPEEIQLITKKIQPEVYANTLKLYDTMSDLEVLQCIEENKHNYAATPEDRQQILSDLQALIEADGRSLAIEEYFIQNISKILG